MAKVKNDWQWDDAWIVRFAEPSLCHPNNWPYTDLFTKFAAAYRRHTKHRVTDWELYRRLVTIWKRKCDDDMPPGTPVFAKFKGKAFPYRLIRDPEQRKLLGRLYGRRDVPLDDLPLTADLHWIYSQFQAQTQTDFSIYDVYRNLLYMRKRKDPAMPKLRKSSTVRQMDKPGGFFPKEVMVAKHKYE